jgi:hypothetical protein
MFAVAWSRHYESPVLWSEEYQECFGELVFVSQATNDNSRHNVEAITSQSQFSKHKLRCNVCGRVALD